ncbi:hypothetical protein DSUL_260044 [Desulfovibrionales bacterium]
MPSISFFLLDFGFHKVLRCFVDSPCFFYFLVLWLRRFRL